MKFRLFVLVCVVHLLYSVGICCPLGDLNGDCRVDNKDIEILAEQWLTLSDSPANLNSDENVNMADFALLAQNWLKAGPTVVINEIHYNPEPKR